MRKRTVAELREGADRVLKRADLAAVYVASASLLTHRRDGEPPFNVDTTIQVHGELVDGRIEARAKYVTSAHSTNDDELESPIWTVELECVASFDLAADSPAVPENDLEAFAVVMGPPTVHPYARELTQSLSSRTPYPALTLGLMRPILAFPDDHVVEFPEPDPIDA